MKEREFQGWVVELAEALGWRVWHVPTPMKPVGGSKFVPDRRGKGLADLIMFHENPPRLIFAELKNEEGDLSDEQKEFLRLARQVATCATAIESRHGFSAIPEVRRPVGVYIWRPGVEEHIEAILKGKMS